MPRKLIKGKNYTQQKLNWLQLAKYQNELKKESDRLSKEIRKLAGKKTTTRKRTKTKAYPYYDLKTWRALKGYSGRPINVKNDKEHYNKTFYKQKVTDQQQKIINRRFKGAYSPFKDDYEEGFQDTIPQCTNECKWIWRCHNHLGYISKAFDYWPQPNQLAGIRGSQMNYENYTISPEQSVYFNKFTVKYEILNPTNYDVNLVIYDVVCKQDTTNSCQSASYNHQQGYVPTTAGGSYRNPIRLIELGLSAQNAYVIDPETGTASSGSVPMVYDSTEKELYDISLKPTESYPFNIYFTIVKKHTFKLQPGATMVHKFTHLPKALVNRGYWAFRYGKDRKANDGDAFRGIKDITSGCLFKYWGQVAGTAQSDGVQTGTGDYTNWTQDQKQVVNLSGRLMFREYVSNRFYYMDPKYTYTWNKRASYKPTDEETLEVANDVSFKEANDESTANEGSSSNPAN